jgi:Holliday junction resolvase RusA-like endonuclease
MKLEFIVFGPPVPLERARVETRLLANGKRITKGRTPGRSAAYRQQVQWFANTAMNAQRWKTPGASARFEITLHIYWSDARRRDCSNILKAIEDALNGGVWLDDSQVQAGHFYSSIDRERPRVEVEVKTIGEDA